MQFIERLGLEPHGVYVAVGTILGLLSCQFVYRIIKAVRRIRKIAAVVNQLPRLENTHWFWGDIFNYPGPNEKGMAWALKLMDKYPKYNSFYVGWWKPSVALRHPDCIKAVLKTTEPKALSDGGGYSLLVPWLGDGLLLSSGPKWFRNRKLLTPGFHFDILKPYMEIYHSAANALIAKLEAASAKGSVEIFKPVSLCTLDVMLQCAFTFQSNVQSEDSEYVAAVNSLAGLVLDRAFKPWMYWNRLYSVSPNGKRFRELCDYVHGIADDLITSRRALLESKSEKQDPSEEGSQGDSQAGRSSKKYVDFLDILLLARDEQGEGLSHTEIRQEVDTFLFEGHDTTASAISWLLYSLATHPDHQRRCQEEVDALFPDPARAHMTWDDLQKVPYLTQCVKESLRMYPPVPTIMRELVNPLEFDGYKFEPGTNFTIPIYSLHHNPTVWGDDHMEYKPERFSPDRAQKMDSHAFLPFSAGPRNCIGQNFALHEVKVVAARVLRHFSLAADPGHRVEKVPAMTMRARHGIKLIFTPRGAT